ncbi:MAG: hypothetical protein KBF99_09465 [Leptospiraceae bacterium]|nr:hypothetical protein [Leptospiraceae bacterium]MBP9163401.1 hypothetical protein [Leptospiraceae bacterium]
MKLILLQFCVIFFLLISNFNCKKNVSQTANENLNQKASTNPYEMNYPKTKAELDSDAKWDDFEMKSEMENYYIVNDPNGLTVYSSSEDFKSKKDFIPRGVKFQFTTPAKKDLQFYIDPNKIWWKEIKWDDKTGWLPWNLNYEKQTLKFSHSYMNAEKYQNFALSQETTQILELPMEGSKVIETIPAFKILKSNFSAQIMKDYRDDYETTEYFSPNPNEITWHEIETSDGKLGYTSDKNIHLYSEREEALNAQKDKRIFKKGYFVIKNYRPNLYRDNPLESISNSAKVKISKEKIHFVTNSEIINGIRYYILDLESKLKKNKSVIIKDSKSISNNRNILISEKDGVFYNIQEFPEYTAKHTSFKGDKRLIDIMRKEYEGERFSMYLNYSKFELRKISNKSKDGNSYYLGKAYLGANPPPDEFDRRFKYMIFLKNKNGEYLPMLSGLTSSIPIRILDLDKDGNYEIETEIHERVSNKRNLYILKDGKYISSADLLPKGYDIDIIDVKRGLIYAGHGFHFQFGKEEREKGMVFKLQKGEFIPTDFDPALLTDIKHIYKMRED